ncbi:MAG: fibronectin type III domain-containing protein [Chloroflexota bacterium]|nr:fibronectin type III domain-containing protein [Chloroflexota bacterium]
MLTGGSLVIAQTPSGNSAGTTTLTGNLTMLWGDPAPSSNKASVTLYYLQEDNGQTHRLILPEALTAPYGGILALTQKRVTLVVGNAITAPTAETLQAGPALTVQSIQPDTTKNARSGVQTYFGGNRPFINLLCKFADVPAEPKPPTYFNGLVSNTYPGLGDYWRNVSYNNINIESSTTTTRWYTLPQTLAYYQANGDAVLTNDCVAATKQAVYFPNYYGFNVMLNAIYSSYSWGGWNWFTLDGVSRTWGYTVLQPWGYMNGYNYYYGGQAVMAHEIGHSFRLPHSNDPFGVVYNNLWDVMSYTYNKYLVDPTYGIVGQDPIAFHKDLDGWIPANRKFNYSGVAQTITLEQLDQPGPNNYLMAQIPIGGSATLFYTIEARKLVGYDRNLPTAAVIIHKVDTTRSEPAWVVGTDGGMGAAWTPGMVYTDLSNGIYIEVKAATATGFVISITPPLPTAPTNLTATTILNSQINLSWTASSGNVSGYLIKRGYEGSPMALLTTVGPNITAYQDKSVQDGTTYCYEVYAYNGYGNSNPSTQASTSILLQAPSNLTATAFSESQITLSWINNSSTATTFKILRMVNNSASWSLIAEITSNLTTYQDTTNISENNTYSYQVYAYSTRFSIPLTSVASNTVNYTAWLNAPTGLTITAVSATQVNLSWTNHSFYTTDFRVERKDIRAGTNYTPVTHTPLGTTNPVTFADNTVSSGTLYYYRVVAIGSAHDSKPSNEVSTLTATGIAGCDVANSTDTGQSGSLRFALNQGCTTISINLPNPSTTPLVLAAPYATALQGVTLGGICGSNGPAIQIKGSGLNGSGLILGNNNLLYGVKISQFGGSQLQVPQGTNNKFYCTAFSKN